MWELLIKQYWQVSMLKESPANTPYSIGLCIFMGGLFFSLILTQWMMTETGVAFKSTSVVFAALILLVSYGVYTALLLSLFRLSNRTLQTLTCILAGHTIVHFFAFPLLFVSSWVAEAKMIESLALWTSLIYLMLTLMLAIWQFMITVHVYKQALEIGHFPAILASVGLIAFNILFVSFWR